MPDLRQLVTRFGGDLKPLDRTFEQANQKTDAYVRATERHFDNLTSKMRNIGVDMSVAITAPLTLLGKASIEAAMDAGEVANKFEVAFKQSAGEAKRWAEEFSKAAGGLNVVALEERAASFQLLFNAMDMAPEKATKMSTALTQLAYDFASLYNVSNEEAFVRLTSGMVGETEAVRRFGVDISDAAMKQEILRRGIGKTAEEMSQAEKVSLRFSMIMRQSADAQGDLIKTQESASNKTRLMKEEFATAGIELGESLIPVYLKGVGVAKSLASAFSAAPEPIQKTIIALGGIAWVTGPVLTAGAQIAQMILTYKLRQIAAATAVGVETIAEVANTAAKARNAGTTTALATVTMGQTTAIVAQTAALRANTSAWTALMAILGAPVAAATVGAVVGAGAAVAVGLGVGIHHYGKQAREAQDNIRKTMGGEQDAFRKTYAKHSTEQLERDLERQKVLRAEAIDRRKDYSDSSWWSKWQPANKVDNRSAEYDYKTANQRVLWLKKELAARQQETETSQQLSDEARKAIAANEEVNRTALQQKYILSQANDHARAIAEARVEFVNRQAEIAAKAKEAKDKFGVILDTQAQLAAAQYEYNQKVKEANEKAASAAADANTSVIVAGMELEALQTRNTYEAERLRVQAQLTQTVRELTREKASEVEFKLAEARAAQQIVQINEREQADKRDRAIGDARDTAIADAIRRGDSYAKVDIEAAEQFMRTHNDYVAGKASAAAMNRGLEEFNQAIRENQERKRKDLERQQKEEQDRVLAAYEKQLATWRETVSALGEGNAAAAEMVGDTRSAALARFQAESAIKEEELARRKREAVTDDEKRLAGILETNWAAEKQRKTFDLLTGGVQSFYDRLKARKEEAVRGWEEQAQAARAYYDEMKGRLTLGTMDAAWRREMETGLRVSMPEPFIPPPPNTQITQTDIEREFREMNRANTDQVELLDRIARSLENLAPVPGWSGA